jgi:G:T-mismatch repair DNA endonuclease (very short patch repair protein)
MQQVEFPDERAYRLADMDEEKIAEADKLYKQRLRKSRYVVWDIETTSLNQQAGYGQQVPYLIVAATVCYKCNAKKFCKPTCETCGGRHLTDMCITNEPWDLDHTHQRVSCWNTDGDICDECDQRLIIIQSGCKKSLFKSFLDWLLCDTLNGYTLVAHNGAGFDTPYLLHAIRTWYGLSAETLMRGSMLLQLVVKKAKDDKNFLFRAIDSAQFYLAALKNLPRQFGLSLELKKGLFPYKFDKVCNWNYVGAYPDLECYSPNLSSSKEAAEIAKWHRQQSGKLFHFRLEATDYCLEDVRILLSALQVSTSEDWARFGFDGMAESCTIASKTAMVFQHEYLVKNTIGVIGSSGYKGHRNQSTVGLLWLLLQERDHPGMQHAMSTRGEKVLLGCPVDGFHEATNTVFQFHGCFWHGCVTCYTNRWQLNHVNNESFDQLHSKTVRRTQRLRKAGFTVVEKWECQFGAVERDMAKRLGLESKIPQLVPKEGFFGGRTEAVNLHVELSTSEIAQGKRIHYFDVCSEYPYVNFAKTYPVGHPEILLSHDCPQSNGQWVKRRLFGMVKCDIIPPFDLRNPLLPYRHNGSLVFPLCRACCEEHNTSFCEHSIDERTLTGTWPTIEIDKALDLGYVLRRVHEVWHFKKQSTNLFKPFISKLYKDKLEASGYPDNVVTEAEKDAYILSVREHEGIELAKEKIALNAPRRQMSKILLNSFWGKFGQKEERTEVEFVKSLERLNELVFSDNLYEVRHASPTSESEVYVVFKKLHARPNPKSNIFIAAITTAHARLHLYQFIERLDDRVVYTDTDSVVFTHQPGQYIPPLGPFLGDLTNEVPHGSTMVEFTTCGPKNYAYTLCNQKGELSQVVKVKGLRLNNLVAPLVNLDAMNCQVGLKRKGCLDGAKIPSTKRLCLAHRQRVNVAATNDRLNTLYEDQNFAACAAFEHAAIEQGPCNCVACNSRQSVTVPQVRFFKNRRGGFVQTEQIRKQYQLVLRKRWLPATGFLTLPFGFEEVL